MHPTRRSVLAGLVTAGALATGPARAAGEAALSEFRIGYQKIGLIVVTRQQQLIEKQLADRGVKVRWFEFQAGPPLLEALNAGSIDFGYTGDAPPIFSQAAGGNLVYTAAAAPSGEGEAILVKEASPIRTVADLKGRKVAVARGTSSHNLLVAALEKAGLRFSDITPVYLSPADAGSAFTGGSVDAWAIWDPYFAIAQARDATRVLTTSGQTLDVSGYFLANKPSRRLIRRWCARPCGRWNRAPPGRKRIAIRWRGRSPISPASPTRSRRSRPTAPSSPSAR